MIEMGVRISPRRSRSSGPLSEAALAAYHRDPRLAITETGVVCLVCGHSFRHLTNTHLPAHGLTSDEYKARFGYNARRALMVAAVRRTHSENASRSGLALRIRRRPIIDDIELRRLGGRHRHTLEEALARRERGQRQSTLALARDQRGRFASLAGARR